MVISNYRSTKPILIILLEINLSKTSKLSPCLLNNLTLCVKRTQAFTILDLQIGIELCGANKNNED